MNVQNDFFFWFSIQDSSKLISRNNRWMNFLYILVIYIYFKQKSMKLFHNGSFNLLFTALFSARELLLSSPNHWQVDLLCLLDFEF